MVQSQIKDLRKGFFFDRFTTLNNYFMYFFCSMNPVCVEKIDILLK